MKYRCERLSRGMKGGGGEEQEIPRVRVESRKKYYLAFYMDSRARPGKGALLPFRDAWTDSSFLLHWQLLGDKLLFSLGFK